MILSSRQHNSRLALLASVCLMLLAAAGQRGGPAVEPSSVPSPPPGSLPAGETKIVKVLYVEGNPRWEYRYIKRALLHHPAVRISCLLTSAEPAFEQEASDPDPKIGFQGQIKAFPDTADGLAAYDVVLFGDVDKRLLTDKQLELIGDFVRKHGGGFGMIAGPRFAPVGYRDTPIANLLPVDIDHVKPDGKDEQFREGFVASLTEAGRASLIFRSLQAPAGAADEPSGLRQPLYWYSRGVSVRASKGEKPPQVLAVHPSAKAPDGSTAPLLVIRQCEEGKALFSAIDDSWRWRFAGNQSAYDDYWVELLRALAPAKSAGRLPAQGQDSNSLPAK